MERQAFRYNSDMRLRWDEAELTDESGRLVGRAFGASEISLPRTVEVRGDRLVWAYGGRRIHPREGLLDDFVDLTRNGEIEAASVESFARRRGVLAMCEHGLPATHNPSRVGVISDVSGSVAELPSRGGCAPLGWKDPLKSDRYIEQELWEPLAAWSRVSRRTRALLNIAAKLRSGTRGALEDWHLLLGGSEMFESWARHARPFATWDRIDDRLYGSRLGYERRELTRIVNDWLEIADVRPRLSWTSKGTGLPIEVRGMFGALAMQLVLTIARTSAIAICSGCGRSFLPKRKPVEGRRRYCDECREQGIPVRDAMADRRRREKEAAGGKTRKR